MAPFMVVTRWKAGFKLLSLISCLEIQVILKYKEGAEEGPEGNPDSILLQLSALFLDLMTVEYSESSDALYTKYSPVRRSMERIYYMNTVDNRPCL